MKKYWTMMTRDYLSHWSVCNGVREYVSNMLDSPAASEYEIGEEVDSQHLAIIHKQWR
jgi:hypothetical protein